jgi:hypothetical protein
MLFKCSNHFSSLAGWRCTACGATLCADCTGIKVSGTARQEICSRCGGFASPLKAPQGMLHPFSAAQLIGALRWPLTGAGLITIGASAAVVTVLGLAGRKGSVIAAGITVAYLFQIVRHTAHGHDDVPGPADFTSYLEDVIGPSFRLSLALAWIWVPALVWILWHRGPAPDLAEQQRRAVAQAMRPGGPGLSVHGMRAVSTPNGIEVIEGNATPPPPSPQQQQQMKEEQEEASTAASAPAADSEPDRGETPPSASRGILVPILLVLLGVLMVPISLIASALKTPLLVTVNPVVLVSYAVKLGRDYLLLVGFCLCAVAAALALQTAVHVIAGTGFLSRLPSNLLTLAVAFVAFRAIGLLVRARGDDLGYGHEEFYLVPVLGDAQPRYVVREAKPAEPELALPPSALQQAPASPSAAVESPQLPSEAFSQLAVRQDVDGMLALLDKSAKDLPHSLLSAKAWMDLSGQAWQRRRGKAAAVALRRCLDAEPQALSLPRHGSSRPASTPRRSATRRPAIGCSRNWSSASPTASREESPPSASPSPTLAEHHQHIPFVDRLRLLAADLGDLAVLGRLHRHLHLHALEDDQHVAGLHLVAHLLLDLPDSAGDVRGDIGHFKSFPGSAYPIRRGRTRRWRGPSSEAECSSSHLRPRTSAGRRAGARSPPRASGRAR